jgi:serine protease
VRNFLKRSIMATMLMALLVLPMQAMANAASQSAYSAKRHSDTVLHLKFAESDEVVLANGQFISKNGKDLSQVNTKLSSAKVAKKSRLFTASPEAIKAQRQNLSAKLGNSYVPNLNNYYRIVLKAGQNIDTVVASLKQLPNISEVYAEPLPAKAPVSPDYTSSQIHFNAAPQGMGISAASSYPGALGDRTKIADLEYSWNTSHEDLSDARQTDTIVANGTSIDPFYNTNHGTAATGISNGDRNGYGINGIISNAKLHLVNTYSNERGWDIANAIMVAQTKLTSGDVILIEQQTFGPDGHGYVPVEWVPAVYDAIKIATQSGIIVVEPAANGSENLDDPIYGTTFPQGKADSGAIMVGAGAACGSTKDHFRLSFSNYGRRVNVQGLGECVVTSGYGLLNNAAGVNGWYTDGFSGTSSASALIAAVAGSVSSAYEYQKNAVLTPLQIRNLLVQTGTAQSNLYNPGNIGPLPNLNAAILSFYGTGTSDTTAPTAPTNLTGSVTKQNTISLNWSASTDNSGTVSYKIYRNNVLVATTSSLNWTDTTVARKTAYSYKVQATDPSGNLSAFSNTLSLKTR